MGTICNFVTYSEFRDAIHISIYITGKTQQNNHKYAIAGVTKILHENGYHEYASAAGTMIPHASVYARFYRKYAMWP